MLDRTRGRPPPVFPSPLQPLFFFLLLVLLGVQHLWAQSFPGWIWTSIAATFPPSVDSFLGSPPHRPPAWTGAPALATPTRTAAAVPGG